jgi:hypothetical protein
MTRISDLHMVQRTVAQDTTSHDWYGWECIVRHREWTTWHDEPEISFARRPPDYVCRVFLPEPIWDDPAEMRADVIGSLSRHVRAKGVRTQHQELWQSQISFSVGCDFHTRLQ